MTLAVVWAKSNEDARRYVLSKVDRYTGCIDNMVKLGVQARLPGDVIALAYYGDTSGDYPARMGYNDGRTDGCVFCRTHTEDERKAELEKTIKNGHAVTATATRYFDGYVEILSTWVDGIGA